MNRGIALAAIAVITAAILSAPPLAWAAPPSQAAQLCQDAPRGCSVTVVDDLREGATAEVTVIGRPQTRVRIVAYQAITDGPTLTALKPLSAGIEVFTNAQGVAKTDLPIPAVVKDPSSGWVLVSVEGLEGTEVSNTVGTFAPFGARIPTILGDEYGENKPVGTPISIHLIGAIRGTRYAVELQQSDGSWLDITNGSGFVQNPPDKVSILEYVLPRGLDSSAQKLRLRNRSDSSIDSTWLAIPSAEGEAKPLTKPFDPPTVGDGLDGTSLAPGHPRGLVQTAAYGIAGTTALFLAGAAIIDRRRRSRD